MKTRIKLGVIVHRISIVVPWIIFEGTGLLVELKCQMVLPSIHPTKITIEIRKKQISWWRSMIPCIIGVAGSWKFICHGWGASRRLIIGNRGNTSSGNTSMRSLIKKLCGLLNAHHMWATLDTCGLGSLVLLFVPTKFDQNSTELWLSWLLFSFPTTQVSWWNKNESD